MPAAVAAVPEASAPAPKVAHEPSPQRTSVCVNQSSAVAVTPVTDCDCTSAPVSELYSSTKMGTVLWHATAVEVEGQEKPSPTRTMSTELGW